MPMDIKKKSFVRQCPAVRRNIHRGCVYVCTRSMRFHLGPWPCVKLQTVLKEIQASSQTQALIKKVYEKARKRKTTVAICNDLLCGNPFHRADDGITISFTCSPYCSAPSYSGFLLENIGEGSLCVKKKPSGSMPSQHYLVSIQRGSLTLLSVFLTCLIVFANILLDKLIDIINNKI